MQAALALIQSLFSLAFMLGLYGVIYYAYFKRFQGRQPAPAPTLPATRHPEPLNGWVRMACAVTDQGGLWLDEEPRRARHMLSDWNVTDRKSWALALYELLQPTARGLEAWDGVRALRVLMAGALLGFTTEPVAWSVARAVAFELASTCRSFNEIGAAYLVGRRSWGGLPLDGSRDHEDADMSRCVQNVYARAGSGWQGVDYQSFRSAPIVRGVGNIEQVRVALADLITPPRAPAPPPRAVRKIACRYCRALFPATAPECSRCGAPASEPARQAG